CRQNDTRRTRLDLTVPASTHRRNHITATSFRRSSEPRRASAETISVLPTLSTRRRASSLFEISSDKAKAPTLER
ncbi:unnamed protein product, partial [Brassica oleracea]